MAANIQIRTLYSSESQIVVRLKTVIDIIDPDEEEGSLNDTRPNAAKLAILGRSGRVCCAGWLWPIGCGGGWSAGAAGGRPSD
jgi:hypothetical protein